MRLKKLGKKDLRDRNFRQVHSDLFRKTFRNFSLFLYDSLAESAQVTTIFSHKNARKAWRGGAATELNPENYSLRVL